MKPHEWTFFESAEAQCNACKLREHSQCYKLKGEGPYGAAIALVGEAPGWQEERDERPFVGRAGQLLDGCIAEAGLNRDTLFLTNAVRCRPINLNNQKDRKPTLDEVDACRAYTLEEMRRLKPKVIVALGDTASSMLLSKKFGGIQQRRGKATWSDEWNAWIVETLHPSFALRQYAQRHFIIEDLKHAKRIVLEGGEREATPTQVEVVWTLDHLERAAREIIATGHFHFDWETYGPKHLDPTRGDNENGLHLTKARGFCLSIATREGHAYVIPRYLQNITPYWGRSLNRVDDILREIFLSDCRKGGFHVSFDISITQSTLGVKPTNVTFCGMVAHHGLNNHLGSGAHGLKSCAALYTPLGRYDDELDNWLTENGYTKDNKPDHDYIYKAPDALVHKYNGTDSDASLRLEHIFMPQLHEEGLWKIYTTDLLPVALEHQDIDRIGPRINVPYLDQISKQLGDGLETLKAQMTTMAREAGYIGEQDDFNPNSHPQVAALLYDAQGLPILARTDGGKPATGEELLLQLKDMSDFIPLILQYRAFTKVKGTWIDGTKSDKGKKKALRAVLDEDGHARMNTLVTGTETFRFVTRKPFAVHTFPKTVKGMPSVRALIIPEDGHTFLDADYVQQEFCVAPSTRILKSDLTWTAAESVRTGDELIGFDEHWKNSNPRIKASIVERVSRPKRPCYRITTDRGVVVSSAEHLWVQSSQPHARGQQWKPQRWTRTDQLRVGDKLDFYAEPWKTDESREGGYMAGILDGEGYVSPDARYVGFGQNPGVVLDRALGWLDKNLIQYRTHTSKTDKCVDVIFKGRADQLRVLGMTRPSRLLAKSRSLWDGRTTHHVPKTVATIRSIEYVGIRETVALRTSSRTFIAEGLLSHNCVQSIVAGQWDMVEAILDRGEDAHEAVARDLGGVEKKSFLWSPDDPPGYEYDNQTWKSRDDYNTYKAVRSKYKSINFMIMFRGQAKKLARMALNCTGDYKRGVVCKNTNSPVCDCEQTADTWIKQYYERYEAIKWWQYHTIKKGYETGRSWTPFGTYRKLPAFFDTDAFMRYEAERQACNAPIQISGAHVMRRAMLGIQARFRKEKFPGRVVMSIHDELITQVRTDLIEEGEYIVRRYMEQPYPELAGRSLRVDVARAACWGG